MLQITKVDECPSQVTLKVEGGIVSEGLSLLEQACLASFQENQKVVLDLSEVTFLGGRVTFIDSRGVEMLKRMATDNLQVINCSPFIQNLLKGVGNQ